MISAWIPPLWLPPLHDGVFTWDELLCTVLVALVLVVGALVALRFEKADKEETPPSEVELPAEKKNGSL
ncbi:MAG: hypothetical protein WCF84_00510 [Anaerolineae bacterium]